jgi:hypothetical protein
LTPIIIINIGTDWSKLIPISKKPVASKEALSPMRYSKSLTAMKAPEEEMMTLIHSNMPTLNYKQWLEHIGL